MLHFIYLWQKVAMLGWLFRPKESCSSKLYGCFAFQVYGLLQTRAYVAKYRSSTKHTAIVWNLDMHYNFGSPFAGIGSFDRFEFIATWNNMEFNHSPSICRVTL